MSFWDAKRGILALELETAACSGGSTVCPGGLIERTSDGGRTWQVVSRLDFPAYSVRTAGAGVAWVTAGRCVGLGSPGCSRVVLVKTSDGGSTWTQTATSTPLQSVSPTSAINAWALTTGGAPPTGYSLVRTSDGGRTWQPQPDPCTSTRMALSTVDFATPGSGWVMCTSEPATDLQAKAILATTNGGSTWTERATSCPGAMSCAGYLPGMSFLPNGHGWQWLGRYGLATTPDGGRSWTRLAAGVVSDDINEVISATLVNDTTGFILLSSSQAHPACPAVGCGPELLGTENSGHTWSLLSHWEPPPVQ